MFQLLSLSTQPEPCQLFKNISRSNDFINTLPNVILNLFYSRRIYNCNRMYDKDS